MTTTWHAPPDVLARFATAPEELDAVSASSIEQHLVACAECRGVVGDACTALAPGWLATSWDAVADVVDRPRPILAERAMVRLGLPGDLARAVGATAGLQWAWVAAVVALAAGAVAVGRDTGSDSLFLAVAPLVPIAAVLVVFRAADDPAGEAGRASPLYGSGLAFRRAVAVLVPVFLVLGAASLAMPDRVGGGAAWVLPGLALATGSILLSTLVPVPVAGGLLTVGWLLLLILVSVHDGVPTPLSATPVFGVAGQTVALAFALAAVAGIHARRDRFATLEVSW